MKTPELIRDRKALFWALWRVEMLATMASTAAGFIWILGVPLLIAIVSMLLGIQIPQEPAGPYWFWASALIVGVMLGGGFGLMMTARWLVFRRKAVKCLHCTRRFGTSIKERQLLATGRCPACGDAVTDDAAQA
jgi:hypothetical protein